MILADLTSDKVAAKPMVSKKFLVIVLSLAVVAFSAVLGSIFLQESLEQSAASKKATPTGSATGPRPSMPGLGGASSAPANEPGEDESPSEEKPSEEKPSEQKPEGEAEEGKDGGKS